MARGTFVVVIVLGILLSSFSLSAFEADIGVDYGTTFYQQEWSHTGGITLDIPLRFRNENWGSSIGYALIFSEDHFYCSAPAVFGTILFLANAENYDSSDDEEDPIATLAILCIMIPEKFTIHYQINKYMDLGLSIHPWGADFDLTENTGYYSSGVGLAIDYSPDYSLVITPFVRFRYLYVPQQPLLNGGLSVGYRF